jgi:hypothetical protein
MSRVQGPSPALKLEAEAMGFGFCAFGAVDAPEAAPEILAAKPRRRPTQGLRATRNPTFHTAMPQGRRLDDRQPIPPASAMKLPPRSTR